jgi:PBP1b-binding outer membrane lipoprotein LpoB
MTVNKITIYLLFLALALFFNGCAEKELQIKKIPEKRLELNLSKPAQLNLNHIDFYIITEQNKDLIFKQLELSNKDKVLIGLSDEDYIKLAENMTLIQNYIIQQNNIIKSYKDYYESNESTKNK